MDIDDEPDEVIVETLNNIARSFDETLDVTRQTVQEYHVTMWMSGILRRAAKIIEGRKGQ